MQLPDEKPADFSLFRQWMENELFFSHIDEVRKRKPFELARLFCFADRMGAPRLRNTCIDYLHMKAVALISQPTDEDEDEEDSKELLEDCINSWKRAIRWVLSNPGICPDSSLLLKFFTDFFAFSVLQHVRLLEQNLLSDLPAVFLEHVLDAVSTALARHVPGVPALSLHPAITIDVPTTTTTTTTMTEQIDGKTITVVKIDDDGDDNNTAGEAASAQLDTVVKTESGHEIVTVVKPRPKDKLFLPILTQSAVLRALTDGTWQRKEPRKKRAKKSKKKESDEVDEGDNPEGSKEGNDDADHDDEHDLQTSTKSFFGITSLCKYHYHSSRKTRNDCAQKFRARGAQEVWCVVPSLRT
ncbi:hypothetical protein DIS24_g6509 [Lasiodiplodia hormozganensis]|uniref:Uncharacterized protein n=1 Tax=Lasiodiplodia hormozganensis TaxID=869390 RepID=A0AA40CVK5_9PEZI|nr:hypothetical protein DIS24_g6509 [Lasiodiplodia hormozganensis]